MARKGGVRGRLLKAYRIRWGAWRFSKHPLTAAPHLGAPLHRLLEGGQRAVAHSHAGQHVEVLVPHCDCGWLQTHAAQGRSRGGGARKGGEANIHWRLWSRLVAEWPAPPQPGIISADA